VRRSVRRRLGIAPLRWIGGSLHVDEQPDCGCLRNNFSRELKFFAGQPFKRELNSSDIASWMCMACRDTITDRVCQYCRYDRIVVVARLAAKAAEVLVVTMTSGLRLMSSSAKAGIRVGSPSE
jgi:hypothetical protein